ncbi:MAG: oligosaccharide flippase family protein [Planctomycetota bacterium]|nr:oligosaccharide flippase family protein [Planctomycetota bacterium]
MADAEQIMTGRRAGGSPPEGGGASPSVAVGGLAGPAGGLAGADPAGLSGTTGPTSDGAAAPAMGKVVSSGMSWAMALSLVSKLLGALAQIALAKILAPGDFGVYLASLAISNLVLIFRDGGVRELLIQKGAKEYPALVGPVFWMALAINGGTALALAAVAPLAARYSNMPEMTSVLLVTAASLPLATPGAVLMCRLRIDLRFKLVSNIATMSAFIRYVSMVGLALAGMGPMSFVLPLIIIAVFESVAGFVATRQAPWLRAPAPRLWRGFLGQVKWLFLGALAGMMLDQGDYFVALRFIDRETLGYYGFANQLLLQSVYVVLSYATGTVLFPALSRLAGEPERHRQASLRFLRALMLMSAPACIGVALVFEPLERWLLDGKWDASVLPLQILALMYPMRCTIGLTTAALMSQGRFKRWSVLTILEGCVLMGATYFAATAYGTPLALACSTAGSLFVTRLAVVSFVLGRGAGSALADVLGSMLAAWLIAVGAGVGAWWLDGALPAALHPAARMVAVGAAFTAMYGVGARLVLSRQVREALGVLPARLGRPAHRLLLLSEHARR